MKNGNIRHIKNCPACGSDKPSPVFEAADFPAILFPVERSKSDAVEVKQLNVSCCPACQHMFLRDVDVAFNNRIYCDYYYLYPFDNLESMNEQYRKPFNNTFEYMLGNSAAGKLLLEIGCSNEVQFDSFLSKGIVCTGISPGAIASAKVEMIDGFYEDCRFDQKFDYIVSRFNLEHIIDPEQYLLKAHSELKEDGVLFVQVPNVRYFLESGLLNVFAHEHTQYFNTDSLTALLARCGFETVLVRGHAEPGLILCARKASGNIQLIEAFHKNQDAVRQAEAVLEKYKDKKIVIYGAGLSLTGLLYFSQDVKTKLKNVTIVDDNAFLKGKVMPLSDLAIHPSDNTVIDKETVVILLLNSIYHSKILSRLQGAGALAVYALTANGLEKQ